MDRPKVRRQKKIPVTVQIRQISYAENRSADIDAIEASIRAFIHYEPRCLSLYCDRIMGLEAYANVDVASRELTRSIWPTLDHVFRAASEETQRDSFDSERSYSIPMLSIAYLIDDDPKQARILLDCCHSCVFDPGWKGGSGIGRRRRLPKVFNVRSGYIEADFAKFNKFLF